MKPGSLFGWVGLALAVVASGALFPGSAVVSAPDMALVGAAHADPSSTGAALVTAAPADVAPAAAAPHDTAPLDTAESVAGGDAVASYPAAQTTTVTSTVTATTTVTATAAPVPAGIAPSPVLRLQVPAIDVDATVLPVDSTPTGRKNAWGGEIYSTIDFPVDDDVRQWVRRGDPNTLSAAASEGDVRAFDRVLLYGHASDIGNHLVFQDLAALKAGDSVVATTALGRFTYRVTQVYTRAKTNLNSLAALYDYPTDGAKEVALIACLPDTTSNVVVIATLASAQALSG